MIKRLWGKIGFIIFIVVVAGLLFYVKLDPPFMAVASNSMEPTISRGDLIFIKEASAYELKEGDIVVFEVPGPIREKYNYPSTITHRVISVTLSGEGLAFRTKGDNTGEDPFTVLPTHVRGQVGQVVPYLGYVVLFLQSMQGLIFVATSLLIYALYANSEGLARVGRRARGAVFGVPAEEFERRNAELQERVEVFSLGVQQALGQFSSAMSEYAKHIGSHTQAVKDLASASQELRDTVRQQNRVLSPAEGTAEPKQAATKALKPIPGCYRKGGTIAGPTS